MYIEKLVCIMYIGVNFGKIVENIWKIAVNIEKIGVVLGKLLKILEN